MTGARDIAGRGDASGRDDGPVDTLRHPHEPHVETASTVPMLVVVLAGPVATLTHFWVVYLFAEAACAAERIDGMSFTGPSTLSWVVVVVTAVGVLVAVIAAVLAWRRRDRPLAVVGLIMSVGAAATIAAVGLPVLVLAPC